MYCEQYSKGVTPEYDEERIWEEARIIRDKQTKKAYLSINLSAKWMLYSGSSVDCIDFTAPLAEGTGSGIFALEVSTTVRSYFLLKTENGSAILAEKHLPMVGGYNFRDLGGIKTKDGRYVKWGKIIRSDDLHHLTEGDLCYLSSIPLLSVVDFRAEPEVKMAADKLPETVKEHYPYSIVPGNLSNSMDFSLLDAEKSDCIMKDIYRELVSVPENIERYRSYFKLLQDECNTPLLFHCSAGKDRTGMAAAFTLYALGVAENDIINDYLLSNEYLRDKYAHYVAKYPELQSLFEVKIDFLEAAVEWIKTEYATIECYLEQVLEVDICKLRESYLY